MDIETDALLSQFLRFLYLRKHRSLSKYGFATEAAETGQCNRISASNVAIESGNGITGCAAAASAGLHACKNTHHHDPVQRLQQCRTKCQTQQQGQQQIQVCRERCQREFEKQIREQEGTGGSSESTNPREQEQEQTQNPYFFESQRFDSKYRTEHGHVRVLERFSKKSNLLRGIENYRLAILEANPNTFVVPHHWDAESVFVVVGGKGTISYVWQNKRQTFNLRHGDVLRVPAGSLVYLINNDDNERLYILKLLQPINTPGKFKDYFGVGGESNPESYYRVFSNEILEAAFNVGRERLEKLFGQQQKGVIIKASKEQIRALSQESETSSRGGRGEQSAWRPFNLLNERPQLSSRFGQLFEAKPTDFEQLKDLDISAAFMNIKKGGMTAPYYNSKSTKLVVVIGGSGQFEMACPHLSTEQGQQQQGSQGRKERQETTTGNIHYQKVSARLSVGDVFIIPAGHPVTIIASQNSDLKMAAFGIQASYNWKYFLAGRENVWEHVQSEAKELAFKLQAREVEEIFNKQQQSFFLPGPGQRQQEQKGGGGHEYLSSVLDFVGY